MTKVSHQYFFEPTGNYTKSYNKVSDTSSDLNPKPDNGRRRLREIIDPYSARNYWKLNHAISIMEDTPWSGHKEFHEDMKSFSFVDSITTKKDRGEIYHTIETERSTTSVENSIHSYYGCKKQYKIETTSDSNVRLYDCWRTNF